MICFQDLGSWRVGEAGNTFRYGWEVLLRRIKLHEH
jgi:hypothetical protein